MLGWGTLSGAVVAAGFLSPWPSRQIGFPSKHVALAAAAPFKVLIRPGFRFQCRERRAKESRHRAGTLRVSTLLDLAQRNLATVRHTPPDRQVVESSAALLRQRVLRRPMARHGGDPGKRPGRARARETARQWSDPSARATATDGPVCGAAGLLVQMERRGNIPARQAAKIAAYRPQVRRN